MCDVNKLFNDESEILSYHCDTTEVIYHNINHVILYELSLSGSFEPHESTPLWDADHVRMPCSDESKYQVLLDGNKKELKSRWNLIQTSLLRDFSSTYELEKAIKSYNTRYENIWKFDALHEYVKQLDAGQRTKFFTKTLPFITTLALRLELLIKCPIPLLKQGMNKSISMSQEQAGSILANCFLCTFPRRNTTAKQSEYSNYPNINFNSLYNGHGQSAVEKIKCIVNYFERVNEKMPNGVITYTRRSLKTFPDWENESVKRFSSMKYTVTSKFKIEDAQEMLQVDFANKKIGGGVLGNGCIQEEIRFCINPELIVARLFTECLNDNEAVLISGTERFSHYIGYSNNFRFAGDFLDPTECDQNGRRNTQIVAIDALNYKNSQDQFRYENLMRELNKAYVGFYREINEKNARPVATGFWGCGAFNGHLIKSAVIQFMACRLVRRNLVFFTFNDDNLKNMLESLFELLTTSDVSVSKLFLILKTFRQSSNNPEDLLTHIKKEIKNVSNMSCAGYKKPLNQFPLEKSITATTSKKQSASKLLFEETLKTKEKTRKEVNYPRFDPSTFTVEDDQRRCESIKNYFSNPIKNTTKVKEKTEQKKSSKIDFLAALDDDFNCK